MYYGGAPTILCKQFFVLLLVFSLYDPRNIAYLYVLTVSLQIRRMNYESNNDNGKGNIVLASTEFIVVGCDM